MPNETLSASETLLPEDAVLVAVAYADCFDFPLLTEEIATYLPLRTMERAEIEETLGTLLASHRLEKENGYWCLPGRAFLAQARQGKSSLVEKKWAEIHRYLPPVLALSWLKAVLLTGSLAAKNPTERADADLLLILDHRRMWLGYLVLRLFFRMRKPIEFCPNYAISDRSLALAFPNLFTAIEFSMAIPLKSGKVLARFEAANAWYRKLTPNAPSLAAKRVDVTPRRQWRWRVLDGIVRSPLGWLLDRLEYHRLRWRTKGLYQPGETVYKPHPPTRQYVIFQELEKRLNRHRIAAHPVRDHLSKQRGELAREMKAWGIGVDELEEAGHKPGRENPARAPESVAATGE